MRYLQPTYLNTATTSSTVIPSGSYLAPPWPVGQMTKFIVGNDVPYSATAPVTVLLTNLPNAIAVYTNDVTDPNMFDHNFLDAFVHILASRLVLNLSGDKGTSDRMLKMAEEYMQTAMRTDGDEGTQQQNRDPDWMRAHGITGFNDGYFNGGIGGGGYDYFPWGCGGYY